VPYLDGGVFASPTLVAITFSDDTNATDEQNWVSWAATSSWLSEVGKDYGVGTGSALAAISLSQNAPTSASGKDVRDLLDGLFDAGTLTLPLPDASSPIFIVYFPSTTTVTSGGATSCTNFLGYHSWYSKGKTLITYAVIASCAQDVSWNQVEPASGEEIASHEVAETATDPYAGTLSDGTLTGGYLIADPNSPWSYLGGEVGDLCAGSFYQDPDSGYYTQRIYSNSTAAVGTTSPCLPIPANDLYYNVTPDQNVSFASPGQTVTVTLTGWATGTTSDWCIEAVDLGGIFFATPTLAAGTINDGTTTTITLTVPDYESSPGADDAGNVAISYGASLIYNSDCAGNTTAIWPLMVGIPPVGQVCDAMASPDPCAKYALACTQPTSGNASCQLPGEFGACTAPVGCQSAYSCAAVSFGDAGAIDFCAQSCSQTTDCSDLGTACYTLSGQTICYSDFCGPRSGLDGGFFGSCDNAATGDGTCLPVADPAGSYGICYAGGTVGNGQSCGVSRADGGAYLCSVGSLCIGQTLPGTCEPLCAVGTDAAADGGPGCASGSDCVQVGSEDFGVCLTDCTASMTCSAGATCTSLGSVSVCVP
jgi:hypothetical protein